MILPPAYYEEVRGRAAKRWVQLENDPELAGPWHQLFRQVQSPKHVLSELLQNADDAGATAAKVSIEGGAFFFSHNGEDFTGEHFASLCSFAYSNKRSMHTIGFRGIGFKSTFSLGDAVELYTPTLAVTFEKRHFTEPLWTGQDAPGRTDTSVKVVFSDQRRELEAAKNLEEWLKSPESLLFFTNLRCLIIGDKRVEWIECGSGPIPGSVWMMLDDSKDHEYLLVRSDLQTLPKEAQREVRNERMLTDGEGELPQCRIDLLLGAEGRLFVVLPTGVKTALPFACNAPFIQDPARMEIKDPALSPTNRFLLEGAGRLAASCMISWLQRSDMIPEQRARAYAFFPSPSPQGNSTAAQSEVLVKEAFDKAIAGTQFLLTSEGTLTGRNESVILPDRILEVWPAQQAVELFDEKGRFALCPRVSRGDRTTLVKNNVLEELGRGTVLQVLQVKAPPCPDSWKQLMVLWNYLAPEIGKLKSSFPVAELRIIPVRGENCLRPGNEVVRLGENRELNTEADWQFLAQYLVVLDQQWTQFLGEAEREAKDKNDAETLKRLGVTSIALWNLGLSEASHAGTVIDRVAKQYFAQKSVRLDDSVRLAHIAAVLGAKVGSEFCYHTQDGLPKPLESGILIDMDGLLEESLPEAYRVNHCLHPAYTQEFTACQPAEWLSRLPSDQALPPDDIRRVGAILGRHPLRIVTVTATPVLGYYVDSENWNYSSSTCASMPLQYTVSGNTKLFLLYKTNPVFVVHNDEGRGSVSFDPPQPDTGYTIGAQVTITASPAAGYVFNHFGGVSSSTNPSVITVTRACERGVNDYDLSVTYDDISPKQLNTSVSPVNAGTIAIDPPMPNNGYALNTHVTLTATAQPGCSFLHWDGDSTSDSAVLKLTMDGNKNVVAVFEGTPPGGGTEGETGGGTDTSGSCAGCSGGKGGFATDTIRKAFGDLFLAGLSLSVLAFVSRRR